MKREQVSDIITNIDDRHIAEAAQFDPARCGRSPERIVHMKKKRIITFALAAALLLALGAGAFATVYNRRVQDLVLQSGEKSEIAIVGDPEDTFIVIIGEEGENAAGMQESVSDDPRTDDVEMISLQGFADSPEYQAALAWAQFEDNYDPDGSILDAVGNDPTPWDDKYAPAYFVYSQEMADRIDEIAAQYGLTLHSGFQDADMAELYARFGFFAKFSMGYGYCYADGTFQFDDDFNGVGFQLRRSMKGVLDTVFLNIRDAEAYEQWEYTTACGETVLLALGPTKALILADTAQSFVAVNVLSGTDYNLTAGDLQLLADSIDFSIL